MKTLKGFVFAITLICLHATGSIAHASVQKEACSGYTSVPQAITEFENKYGWKIQAPTQFPLTYTHQKGKVYDNEAKLELEYTNASETLLFLVNDRDEILHPQEYHEVVELKDGTKAYYRVSSPGFHQLDFRKGKLIYKVWASSKSKYVTSSKQLVTIANSVPLCINRMNMQQHPWTKLPKGA